MANKHRQEIRYIVEPVSSPEPLLVRLCSAFVDNLTLILRTAFVVGSLFLVQDLGLRFEDLTRADSQAVQAPVETVRVTKPSEHDEPVLTEGVKHALKCTYTHFRNAHYDECVKEPSAIYSNPDAGPDDAGYLQGDAEILYARL